MFCLQFICKHKEILVKTIRCNLTKACRIFAFFTESLCKNMGILSSKFQEISPVLRRIIRSSLSMVMFEALSLLVYTRDPYSKGYNSISILYFSLGLVPL